MSVHWTEDEDGNGWTGVTQVWLDGNTKEGDEHIIHLRQGMPLGSIHVDVDECSHGAWAFSSFEGTGLTERDLQWAALYASEVLKRKNDLLKKM
jgi:hypothetical protein